MSRLVLVVVALLFAGRAVADDPKPCEAGTRAVVARTPVFGGPGLGFDVVRVIEKDGCLRILSTTDDGTFILVELEESKAGWVTSGTVDSALVSSTENTTPADGTFVAVRDLVLREVPRFDALVVGGTVPIDTKLARRSISRDGQWYLMATTEADAREGWVPKYQVAAELPASGAKAEATSTEGWGAARLSRTANADRTPSPSTGDPPVDAVSSGDTPPTTQTEPARGGAKTDTAAPTDPVVSAPPSTTGGPPAPIATGPLLGRTQELSIGVGYRYWLQSYTSDAQQDPYFKYEVASPVGFGLTFDYGWRGDFPLVVDVRGVLGTSVYQHLHVDNTLYTALGSQASLWPRVAIRLHENALVDVDAGFSFGGDGFLNYSIGLEDTSSSTITGIYMGMGPSIAARSRLAGGEWGLLIMEAGIPVGGYTMFPEPGAAYTDYARGKGTVVGDPGLVYAEVRPQNGEDPVDNAPPGTVLTDGAIPIHLMVGADGRVRYLYAFTSLLRVEAGGSFTVRQAFIAGPGRRYGSYSEAANIDMAVQGYVGVNFGL